MQAQKEITFLFTNKFRVDFVAVICNCVWIFMILWGIQIALLSEKQYI